MINLVTHHVVPAALSLLPLQMNSKPARAMMLAIALQESKCLARRQHGNGPARSPWQFEKNGVRGVMRHPASRAHAREVLRVLLYGHLIGHKAETAMIHQVLEHNDVLAAAFARLLLRTDPHPLPMRDNPGEGWKQYLFCWNPGDPKPKTWDAYFAEAWQRLDDTE